MSALPAARAQLLQSVPSVRSVSTTFVLPATLGVVFFLAIAFVGVQQHLTFYTRARDMGIYVQILWNAAQGRPFLSTLLEHHTNHLAEHVALALWPLVPLAGLAPDAIPLILLQQVALAACGLPVYLVARARLGPWAAALVLACFCLMPAMSRVALSEFHPVVVAALPAAAGVACALLDRPRSAALFMLLALLMEEEVAPTLAGLAFLLAVGWAVRRLGRRQARPDHPPTPAYGPLLPATLLGVAVAWAVLSVLVVMPGHRFRGTRAETTNRAAAHYEQVMNQPGLIWTWLTVERGPDAAAALLMPNGGLALLAPAILAVDLPGFIVLFLQDRAGTYAGHWSGPLLPIVWLATASGLARLARRPALLWVGLGVMTTGTLVAYPLDSFLPGGREFEADHYYATAHQHDLRRAVERVPPGANLVATRRIVPHLAAREDLYQFPFSFYSSPLRPESQRQAYSVLDLTDSHTRRAIEPAGSDSILEKRPRYHVERFGESVLLLSSVRGPRPEPAEPRDDVFGSTVKLAGLEWLDGAKAAPTGPAVRLYWEATRRPERRAERVVRILGASGALLAELVGQPLDEYLPLDDWERGQLIAEELTLAPGATRLLVGWREPGGKLLHLDGSGRAELELARPGRR